MVTDLEAAGLARGPAQTGERYWALTVDFEAFAPGDTARWVSGMHSFADCSRRHGLRFEVFLAVEDAVRLRAQDPAGYEAFLAAVRAMEQGGARFHPHCHCVFDLETGARPSEHTGWPDRVDGYPKRSSFYYDVVHRNGLEIGDWMGSVGQAYDRVLAEGSLTCPSRLAFRPGGWDHGATDDDLRAYVAALRDGGYEIDSSATVGAYGTRSWRNGAPFGSNAFWLEGGILELAASASMDCGVGLLSRPTAGAAAELARQPALWRTRRPGVQVTVLHFDHLFHVHRRGGREKFALRDEAAIRARIERLTGRLKRLERLLALRVTAFDELEFEAAPA